MILIFDPSLSYLRWCKIEDGHFSQGRCEFKPGWLDKLTQSIGEIDEIEAMGYVLYHGGEIIKNPVEVISSGLIKKLEQCTKFLPEYNNLTLKIIKYCLRRFPEKKHILLCDTAFFVDLPEEVSTYAVPYELRKRGVRRYGGQGLSHQWGWGKVKSAFDKNIGQAVSVYLGNHSSMVAMKNGKAEETSIGFTNVEGIISTVSCGDIDPTVVFQLHSTGMSFKAINRLLSKESGFAALSGKKSDLFDILNKKSGPKGIALRQIYCYNILKYLGGFISSLGGVNAIIFICEETKVAMPFIRELCFKLKFLGLKLKESYGGSEEVFDLARNDSLIRVFCLKYNKWQVLADWVKEELK